jgi:hypothetical protein
VGAGARRGVRGVRGDRPPGRSSRPPVVRDVVGGVRACACMRARRRGARADRGSGGGALAGRPRAARRRASGTAAASPAVELAARWPGAQECPRAAAPAVDERRLARSRRPPSRRNRRPRARGTSVRAGTRRAPAVRVRMSATKGTCVRTVRVPADGPLRDTPEGDAAARKRGARAIFGELQLQAELHRRWSSHQRRPARNACLDAV